jgi:hypothetical protein
MSQLYFYPYYSRNLKRVASTFWVFELKKRVNTKTIAGVYRYLSKHPKSSDWASLDMKTKFLYLKNSTSPLKTQGKIDRYESVFHGVTEGLDHPLFRLLDSNDITDSLFLREGFNSYLYGLPSQVQLTFKRAADFLETEQYHFAKEQETLEALTKDCSVDTLASLFILYLCYQTKHLAWQIHCRLENAIFCQFVQLFYYELQNKWTWFIYKCIQQHLALLVERAYQIKPGILRKNRKDYPIPYQPMFFMHCKNEQDLTTHIKRHF